MANDPLTVIVRKRWGSEEEVYRGAAYMVKKLRMHDGHACSWHRHDVKTETATCLEGLLTIETSTRVLLRPGESCTLVAGIVHRMCATHGDVVYLESSVVSDQATRVKAIDATIRPVIGVVPEAIAYLRAGYPVVRCGGYDDMCEAYGIELVDGIAEGESGAPVLVRSVDPMEKLDGAHTYVDVSPGGLVGKYWPDPRRALAWAERARGPLKRYAPPGIVHHGSWVTYPYVRGRLATAADAIRCLGAAQMVHNIGGLVHDDSWGYWFLKHRTLEKLRVTNPSLAEQAASWSRWDEVCMPCISCETTTGWHGDLSLENIIIDDDDRLFFIDWHEEARGDPHYDVAKMLKSLQFSHCDRTVTSVKGKVHAEVLSWAEDNGLSPGRCERLMTVVVLKMAGSHGGELGKTLTAWALRLLKGDA